MKKFIDFDKKNRIFYHNVYLEDLKLVIKIPLCRETYHIIYTEDSKNPKKIKLRPFDLTRYTYLTAY